MIATVHGRLPALANDKPLSRLGIDRRPIMCSETHRAPRILRAFMMDADRVAIYTRYIHTAVIETPIAPLLYT